MTRISITPSIGRLEEICESQDAYANRTLSLLASASYTSSTVRSFSSSSLSNTTTEGYPGARYHPGSLFADQVEELAIGEAKAAFGCAYANVQPHSASSANASVLIELLEPGATIMGMRLSAGGHLTHGANASFSGKVFKSIPYGLNGSLIDYDQVRDLALKHRPDLIVCGASSYPRAICFDSFARIASEVGAILLADISHISGLVLSNHHPSPIPHAHVVTTSTYKQLCGPRGGLILSDERFAPASSIPLGQRLNRSVFPLTQGTPDLANIASKAAALSIAQTEYFRELMGRVVELATLMASKLKEAGFNLITGGTDTHMILLDLRDTSMTGKEAEILLENIGILANRNLIPNDKRSPKHSSGLRLGTNVLAIREFDEEGVLELVSILTQALRGSNRPSDGAQATLLQRVRELCDNFPISDMQLN